ncbi:MAG: transferase family [Lasallia pustulata]|uniref:Transferase family n=1 Tax=Lasallia pustulata TaxID=136370 RepID=A0A5M8Q283_9LECA|nr:MAG: transferase family [Lasallia pustulata]
MMFPTEVHTQLSPFDLIPPKVYIKFVIYLPLAYGAKPELVFKNLQTALGQTFEQLPFLNGRVFLRPPKSQGWRPGQLEIRHTEPWHADGGSKVPRQLIFKDLSAEFDYEELRDEGFPFSAYEDELVVSAPFIPDVAKGADVLIAQANFVQGGCLLAGAIHHSVADGTGMMLLMQAWATNCKTISALTAANGINGKALECKEMHLSGKTKPTLPAETYDRELLDRIWRQESPGRKAKDVNTKIWELLGLDPPSAQDALASNLSTQYLKLAWFHVLDLLPMLYSLYSAIVWLVVVFQHPTLRKASTKSGGSVDNEDRSKSPEINGSISKVPLKSLSESKMPNGSQAQTQLPAKPAQRKSAMESSIFYMTPQKFAQLKKDMTKTSVANGTVSSSEDSNESISANDALLALFWRALMKARTKAKYATPTSPDEQALLQSPIDGRSDFSSQVPRLYIGNVVLVNQIYMPVNELTDPSTSLRDVALRIRQGALKVNPRSVQDAFTLAGEVTDYTALKHAFTSLEGSAMMITSLVALPFEKFDFGDRLFGNGGKPENLRPLMGGFNRAFRLCVILPRKTHGGLELLVSLFEDEMEMLLKDEEFTRYATFLCH